MQYQQYTGIRWAALAVYVCTAWYSTGFHAADEHYQVIAFAAHKLGLQPASPMPWEYSAGIRSAFLPALAWAVFKVARWAGLQDPFLWMFVLRAITALLAWATVVHSTRALSPLFPAKMQRPFRLLSYFLWFLPFLFARFAGETWSGLFALLAIVGLMDPGTVKYRYCRTGILFGLAFLCRPPTLALALGAVAWLAMVERIRMAAMVQLCLGLAATFMLGIGIDHWFYGKPVFTAWNYLHTGILGHPDHPFQPFAWWYYPAWVLKYAGPPIGALILTAFGMLLWKQPKSLLAWCMVPFLLLHLALSHKDLRFFYPLAPLLPLLLAKAWQLAKPERMPARASGALRVLLLVAVAYNLLALAVVATSPAGNGSANLARVLHARYKGQQARLNYPSEGTNAWTIRIPPFYLPPTFTDSLVADACGPLSAPGKTLQLLIDDQAVGSCTGPAGVQWLPVAKALPPWKAWAHKAYDLEDARPVWKLYQRANRSTPDLTSAP